MPANQPIPFPAPITAEAVFAERERSGDGLERCKRRLERDRMVLLLQAFDLDGDRKKLTEVLFKLVERMVL